MTQSSCFGARATILGVGLTMAPRAAAESVAPPADVADDQSGADDHAGAAEPTEADQIRARNLFVAGSVFYERAQYGEAIARFEEAYRLSGRPDLLFNLAQAHRQEGPAHCATALHFYERHLQEAPEVSNRIEVEELIAEMRRCAETSASTSPVPAPSPPVPTTRTEANPSVTATIATAPGAVPVVRTWPIWTARAGVALALVGAGGYVASRIKYQSVKDTCPCPPSAFRGWERVTGASYGLMGTGAGALAIGLLANLVVSPHGVSVAVTPPPGFRAGRDGVSPRNAMLSLVVSH